MRNFTIIDAEQRSEAWKTARLGRLTSSRAADMLAMTQKGDEAAGRRNLRVQLTLERITGRSAERNFTSNPMQHGIETEPEALAYYEALSGNLVERTGFLSHNERMVGTSLDGHIGEFEGIVEIKCPLSATHLEYLRSGQVPSAYMKQVVHALYVTGAQWCDWLSYDSAFPEELRAKVVRVKRDEAAIKSYELAVSLFLSEVDKEVDAVRALMAARVA